MSRWLVILLFVLSAFAFAPWRSAEFSLWDDNVQVYENPHFLPVTWSSLADIWKSPYESLYIPVTYSIWGFVVFLLQFFWGSNWPSDHVTAPFLAMNFIFHILNGYLLFKVLRFIDQHGFWSWMAVGLFLVHPIQVEAVATVSGFKELIWVSFGLAAILAQIHSRFYLTFLFATLSMFSKPTAAVLPLVLMAVEFARNSQIKEGQIKEAQPKKATVRLVILFLPLFVLSAVVLGISKWQQADQFISEVHPLFSRILVVLDTYGFYLRKIFSPMPLTPDYGRKPSWVLSRLPTLEIIFSLVALSLIGILLWKLQKHRKKILVALAFLVLPLAPVSGIVSFLQQNYSTVADRYFYFPMAGLSLLLVSLPLPRSKLLALSAAAVLFLCAWLANGQSHIWSTNESTFAHFVQVNERSFAGHNNLGILASSRGDDNKALEHFKIAMDINPLSVQPGRNQGVILVKQGRHEEAEALYKKLLISAPNHPEILMVYGYLLAKLGRNQEALDHFLRVIKQKPSNRDARFYAGILLCRLKRCREALEHFSLIAKAEPTNLVYKKYLRDAEFSAAQE